jgi:hypothetical protein
MMKLLLGGAVAALVVSIDPAIAQPAPPPPGVAQGTAPAPLPPPRPQMHVRMMADRTMTRDEVVRHVRELFARFDTNRDGFITKDEIHASRGMMTMHMHASMEKGMREHAMDMPMGEPGAMFDRLDTNHDGVISRQEFMAAHSQMRERHASMMMHDRNAPGHMHGMGMGAHLFEMADANHDGRVSLQEAEAAALAHFDRADLNHDGKLTPEERRQAHQLMHGDHRPG